MSRLTEFFQVTQGGSILGFALHFLLILFCISLGHAQTSLVYPANVEVDLVFPRNETYSTAKVFPIVFVVQNPASASSLNLNVSWILWEFGPNLTSRADGSPLPVSLWTNTTSSLPLYLALATDFMNRTGSYRINWSLAHQNCTSDLGYARDGFSRPGDSRTHAGVYFTIEDRAKTPTKSFMETVFNCPSISNVTSSVTFNITGAYKTTDAPADPYHGSCAILSRLRQPPRNPCGLKIDHDTADRILADVTSDACSQEIISTGCPPTPIPSETKTPNAGAATFSLADSGLLSLLTSLVELILIVV